MENNRILRGLKMLENGIEFGRALMSGVSALVKKLPCPFYHVRTQWEDCERGSGLSPVTIAAGALALDFSPQNCKKEVWVVCKPASWWYVCPSLKELGQVVLNLRRRQSRESLEVWLLEQGRRGWVRRPVLGNTGSRFGMEEEIWAP